MTHFVGIVLAKDENDLERLLAPYHEFECTGRDDEFVQTLDITDKARAEYEAESTRRLRSPDGALHSPYNDEFYRDPTAEETSKIGKFAGTGGGHGMSWTSRDWQDGRGYRTKVRFVPEGWEEVTLPTKEVESFRDFACGWYGSTVVQPGEKPDLAEKHKYGWIEVDASGNAVRVIDRTNPNKQWDWWVVGGRWADTVPDNRCAPSEISSHFDKEGYMPSVLVDEDGWHASKHWGWFGTSAPTDTPDIAAERLAKTSDDLTAFVVDFHI